MKTLIRNLLAASLLCGGAASAVDNLPTRLSLTTLDDDLRAGGAVSVVLRMRDGHEQVTLLVSNETLPNNSRKEFPVAPAAPYDWADVKDVGLRVKPHRGDGMLLQPDQWKVFMVLQGHARSCTATTRLMPGDVCFTGSDARWHFQREETQWAPFRSMVGKCAVDGDCSSDGNFCSVRTARCDLRASGADVMGCVRLPSPQPACGTGQTCNEQSNRCVVTACATPDKDGDGEDSIACGGADCDDNDRERSPGRTEVCDSGGKDEDCNVNTFGNRDLDGDGFFDAACWNDKRQ